MTPGKKQMSVTAYYLAVVACLLVPGFADDFTHVDNDSSQTIVASTIYDTSGFTNRVIPPDGSDVDQYNYRAGGLSISIALQSLLTGTGTPCVEPVPGDTSVQIVDGKGTSSGGVMVMSNDAVDNGPYIDNLCTILPATFFNNQASRGVTTTVTSSPAFNQVVQPKTHATFTYTNSATFTASIDTTCAADAVTGPCGTAIPCSIMLNNADSITAVDAAVDFPTRRAPVQLWFANADGTADTSRGLQCVLEPADGNPEDASYSASLPEPSPAPAEAQPRVPATEGTPDATGCYDPIVPAATALTFADGLGMVTNRCTGTVINTVTPDPSSGNPQLVYVLTANHCLYVSDGTTRQRAQDAWGYVGATSWDCYDCVVADVGVDCHEGWPNGYEDPQTGASQDYAVCTMRVVRQRLMFETLPAAQLVGGTRPTPTGGITTSAWRIGYPATPPNGDSASGGWRPYYQAVQSFYAANGPVSYDNSNFDNADSGGPLFSTSNGAAFTSPGFNSASRFVISVGSVVGTDMQLTQGPELSTNNNNAAVTNVRNFANLGQPF